jgi:hypothetical protein
VKRLIPSRPSPALVIACLALFVSLGGVSWGVATGFIDSREIRNNTVRTQDVRNNDIRGVDIRNSTIRTRDVALNSLTGADINESRLGRVPTAGNAGNADTLAGLGPGAFARSGDTVRFSLKLGDGQVAEVARHGAVTISARCLDDDGGTDRLRLIASTSSAEAVMAGADNHFGDGATGFLTPGTPESDRRLVEDARPHASDTRVRNIPDAGAFVAGPDGRGLHLEGESAALGFDYAGGKCFAAGVVTLTG